MMDALATLAVTGVTGVVGGLVSRGLELKGLSHRLLVRTPAKAPEVAGTSIHAASYADGQAARAALSGVATLFMVSAAESETRLDEHRTFIDAAAAAGVRHVVYTSFVGAAPDATFTLARDHFFTEEHIRGSGMGWTFLRDNFYMDIMEHLVGTDGVIRGPAGDGTCAIVAREDVARVAVEVLGDPEKHSSKSYDITGPEALSFEQIAATLSDVRGHAVSFHDESVAEAYDSRGHYGAQAWELDAWVSTYTAIRSGELAQVSGAVHDITGISAVSFERFLREHSV
ncbi:NmrA family NAD(P)-binding protein [Leucobacter komagatae]|nr:NAD(P)H-binding protein [Leucobacter komagatae]